MVVRIALNIAIFGVVIVAIWSAVPGPDPGLRGTSCQELAICDAGISLVIREVDPRSRQITMGGRIALAYGVGTVTDGAVATLVVRSHQNLVSRPEPIEVEFPLPKRTSGENDAELDLPTFKVPLMEGSMTNYPHDRYTAFFRIALEARGVTLVPHGDRREGSGLFYAISSVRLDDNLSDWSLPSVGTANQGSFSNAGANFGGAYQRGLQIDLERPQKTLTFIYCVLLTPLLLVVALLLARWRSDKTSPLELAAALLAVLTLRQVLVPQDIAGFTVLDKFLGIEVTIIAAATIFVHTRPARGTRTGVSP